MTFLSPNKQCQTIEGICYWQHCSKFYSQTNIITCFVDVDVTDDDDDDDDKQLLA